MHTNIQKNKSTKRPDMKKFLIPLAIIALIFVVFFLLLKWTDTPLNLSLVGAGVATMLMGIFGGVSFFGKPLEAIKLHYDKYTDIKKVGNFLATFIMCLTVTNAIIQTIEGTMESLPFGFYLIASAIAVILGMVNRKIFMSLATEERN